MFIFSQLKYKSIILLVHLDTSYLFIDGQEFFLPVSLLRKNIQKGSL